MTFEKAERLLDAGRLEMMRPWGDWVRVRRAAPTLDKYNRRFRCCEVFMEGEVLSNISESQDRWGQPYLRERAA